MKDASINVCADCGKMPHDVKHLFVCPGHPTTLIPSDIWNKPVDSIWKEHLDVHWDHRHNTHILWKTIHGLSNRAPQITYNNSTTFNNKIANTPKHIANCFPKEFTNTQHTKQTDPLTGQHKTYKDTILHSPLLRSKRQ